MIEQATKETNPTSTSTTLKEESIIVGNKDKKVGNENLDSKTAFNGKSYNLTKEQLKRNITKRTSSARVQNSGLGLHATGGVHEFQKWLAFFANVCVPQCCWRVEEHCSKFFGQIKKYKSYTNHGECLVSEHKFWEGLEGALVIFWKVVSYLGYILLQ